MSSKSNTNNAISNNNNTKIKSSYDNNTNNRYSYNSNSSFTGTASNISNTSQLRNGYEDINDGPSNDSGLSGTVNAFIGTVGSTLFGTTSNNGSRRNYEVIDSESNSYLVSSTTAQSKSNVAIDKPTWL